MFYYSDSEQGKLGAASKTFHPSLHTTSICIIQLVCRFITAVTEAAEKGKLGKMTMTVVGGVFIVGLVG